MLERCAYCDARFDPAALDAVIYHATGDCLNPDREVEDTGIRGEAIDETPQA